MVMHGNPDEDMPDEAATKLIEALVHRLNVTMIEGSSYGLIATCTRLALDHHVSVTKAARYRM